VKTTLLIEEARLKPAVFDTLPDNPDFVSIRGNRYFSRQRDDLRAAAGLFRGASIL